jgi:rhodanese-related sulfurtransferase
MRAADAYGELLRIGRPVVQTREAATRLHTSPSSASHLLRSMKQAGLAYRLRQGLWGLRPDIDPFVLAPYLTAPFPAYVSFWSALARHSMIEQIPRQISVASLDRTRQIKTTIGAYSIHHLAPELVDGYSGSQESGYLATPEKALFDTVYIRASRATRIFLPELSLPDNFDELQLQEWTNRIATPRLRTLVSRGVTVALGQATRDTPGASTLGSPGAVPSQNAHVDPHVGGRYAPLVSATDRSSELSIEPAAVERWIDEDGALQVVDVREPYEREAGHIAGSLHIELVQLPAHERELDRERPVVFYCRVGARSLMAAQAFRAAGFEAYSLEGGLLRWAGEGLPLVPEDGHVAEH